MTIPVLCNTWYYTGTEYVCIKLPSLHNKDAIGIVRGFIMGSLAKEKICHSNIAMPQTTPAATYRKSYKINNELAPFQPIPS